MTGTSEQIAAWREANPERAAEIAALYLDSPHEYYAAYARAWREANPERARENNRRGLAALRKRRGQRTRAEMQRELEDRFWAHVDWSKDETVCWPWTGYVNDRGYGRFRLSKGVLVRAHRLAYELEIDSIPEGLELDHLCRNRRCCNPWHLEPVDHTENIRRSAPAMKALADGRMLTPRRAGAADTRQKIEVSL